MPTDPPMWSYEGWGPLPSPPSTSTSIQAAQIPAFSTDVHVITLHLTDQELEMLTHLKDRNYGYTAEETLRMALHFLHKRVEM